MPATVWTAALRDGCVGYKRRTRRAVTFATVPLRATDYVRAVTDPRRTRGIAGENAAAEMLAALCYDAVERIRIAQRELRVRDRRERQAMDRRDPALDDRGAVLGRRVADVGVEVPVRMPLGGAAHVAVARDLREDRCRRDRGRAAVAVDDR